MHRFLSLAVVLLSAGCATAPIPPGMADSDEVRAIQAIVEDVYVVVSGERGADRPWDRLAQHFLEGARLTLSRPTAEGSFVARSFTPEEFIENARRSSEQRAFHESPLVTRVLQFQGVAVAISSYEARVGDVVEPSFRGVNTFQLVRTAEGWRIASIAWSDEDAVVKLPPGWDRRER
ncbi:MAG: hypothetical protein ACO4CZ_02935 [Planctomycetota bacterium]